MGLRDRLKGALGLGAKTHLQVGQTAPALDVADATGHRWTLAELRGSPFILYFYPKDDTPGCTREACDFRDRTGALEARGARVFGVSTDDARSHAAFAQKFNLAFPLLVDTGGALTQRYGVAGSMGSRRVTFLVDREGRIARIWEPVEVKGHAEDVLAALATLS